MKRIVDIFCLLLFTWILSLFVYYLQLTTLKYFEIEHVGIQNFFFWCKIGNALIEITKKDNILRHKITKFYEISTFINFMKSAANVNLGGSWKTKNLQSFTVE